MYKQVKSACIKKESPLPYGEILAKKSMASLLFARAQNNSHTKLFLENYLKLKSGEIQNEDICLPPQYYQAIKGDETVREEVKKIAEEQMSNHTSTLALTALPNLLEDPDNGPSIDEFELEIENICEGYTRAMDITLYKIEQLLNEKHEDPTTEPRFTLEEPLSSQCPIF